MLQSIYADDEQINDIISGISDGTHDGAWHLHNNSIKESIIILLPSLIPQHALNIISHELYHCADSILRTCYIDDQEADAYLVGFIFEKFYPVIKHLIK